METQINTEYWSIYKCQAIIPHYQRVNEIEEGCSHRFDSCPDYKITKDSEKSMLDWVASIPVRVGHEE
jgi:hypothetical protein